MQAIAHSLIPRDFNRLFSLVAGVAPGQIYLLSGPRRLLGGVTQEVLDRVAVQSPVRIVVGGNRYQVDRLPLLLEGQGGRIYEVLNQITLTRAETPYQMVDALHSTAPQPHPIFITDFLHNFYDEGISDAEAARLVARCLGYMDAFSRQAPVVVSAAPDDSRPALFPALAEICDLQLQLHPEEEAAAVQAPLF